eukprot:gene6304-biopygen10395
MFPRHLYAQQLASSGEVGLSLTTSVARDGERVLCPSRGGGGGGQRRGGTASSQLSAADGGDETRPEAQDKRPFTHLCAFARCDLVTKYQISKSEEARVGPVAGENARLVGGGTVEELRRLTRRLSQCGGEQRTCTGHVHTI